MTRTNLLLSLGVASLALASPLLGQEIPVGPPGQAFPGVPPVRWSGSVGLMVLGVPQYPGAADWRVLPLPAVSAEYRQRFFVGPVPGSVGAGGGIYAVRTAAFTWTVSAGLGDSRAESRAPALAGMGDRGVGVTTGTGISYRVGMLQLGSTLSKGFNEGAGWTASANIGVRRRFGRWLVGTSTGVTLANASQMAHDFGVDAEQAARRTALVLAGDPRLTAAMVGPYVPRGGLRSAVVNGVLGYALTPQWVAQGTVGVTRLVNDAAQSPLVTRPTQAAIGGSLLYRWSR